MIQMFAIANCDTVKKARNFLEKNKITYEFMDFKKTPPTKEQIQRWGDFLGELPINKKGVTYRKFKDQFETLGLSDKIDFIIANTSIIKRPVLEKNGKIIACGFNEQEFHDLF